ncbi:MAG: MFS transporter [Bacteroidaceae bacterium]|nr:MFS transporter [Bacteroidaceae bacterium]
MNYKKLLPVMLCFFAMGFVDMVGIASNYVKADLDLSDSMANTLPSLVFLWFLIFSIPTSLLMNKIGRKNTVLLSLVLTLAAMVVPVFTLDFTMLLLSFSLLGIGNAIMQTSLNPLVDSVMKGGASASTLTFGQFIKSIASFLAPIIASWGATTNAFGFGWRAIYPIYLCIGILTTLLLFGTKIEDPKTLSNSPLKGEKQSSTKVNTAQEVSPLRGDLEGSFFGSFALLRDPFILLCFLAIICHVGIDVGTSVTAPKILMERAQMSLNEAAIIGTIYFVAKAAGSFSGSFIMGYVKDWTFLLLSVLMMVVSAFGLVFGESATVIYVSVALMGFGNGNPFSIVFARALQAVPDKKNEVSGLLIMGIFGGTVFPLLMGFASDAFGQTGAVAVMSLGIIYLLAFYLQGRKA